MRWDLDRGDSDEVREGWQGAPLALRPRPEAGRDAARAIIRPSGIVRIPTTAPRPPDRREKCSSPNFTFGDALLTVLEIFLFVVYFWILITIFADLFRDHQMSGWGKAGWVLLLLFAPSSGC